MDDVVVPAATALQHNTVLSHRVHRHEPPVLADAVDVIHEDDSVLVVNKPATMPVHPCGRYRHNTVVGVLAHEYQRWSLRVVHRLDRLTSGVLIFAKTVAAAQRLEREISDRHVHKEYLARVRGKFPGEGKPVSCDLPLRTANSRIGVCVVDPSGKPARTVFHCLRYDAASDTSIVRCLPEMGRMHQIRVHLQHVGHPVANDPVYTLKEWEADPRVGATTAPAAEVIQHVAEVVERQMHMENELPVTTSSLHEHESPEGVRYLCSACARAEEDGAHLMRLDLHALRYAGPGWAYTTPAPVWAGQIDVESCRAVIGDEKTAANCEAEGAMIAGASAAGEVEPETK